MKKIIVMMILISGFIFIFILLFGENICHNSEDKLHWKQLSSNIKEDK